MKAVLISIFWATTSMAATLDFTAEKTISQCPPGTIYTVECKTLSDVTTQVHLDLKDYGQGYYQSSWDDVLETANFNMIASVFTNYATGRTLSLIIDVGYETQAHISNQWDPAHPPYGILVNGSRKVDGIYELVPELKISGIKYTP